jgi:ATP-dependent RNA helicase RhlE
VHAFFWMRHSGCLSSSVLFRKVREARRIQAIAQPPVEVEDVLLGGMVADAKTRCGMCGLDASGGGGKGGKGGKPSGKGNSKPGGKPGGEGNGKGAKAGGGAGAGGGGSGSGRAGAGAGAGAGGCVGGSHLSRETVTLRAGGSFEDGSFREGPLIGPYAESGEGADARVLSRAHSG